MSLSSPSAVEPTASLGLAPDLLADLLDAIAAPVYAKDAQHSWRYANQALCDLLGISRTAMLADGELNCLPATQARQLRQQDEAYLLTHEAGVTTIALSTPAGDRDFTARRRLMRDAQGTPLVVTTLEAELAAAPTSYQDLEEKLAKSTHKLETLLATDETLKRITDRVRDSLDEKQILQTAVRELTEALGAKGANTSLYDLNMGTSTIYYE